MHRSPRTTTPLQTISIRPAQDGDRPLLRRLAALDSAEPLSGDVLLAEADGEVVAALSLADGRAVADPFRHTADLVELLRTRARLMGAPGSRSRHGRLTLRRPAPRVAAAR